ncbi:AAA family ATPase [Streptomyces sp. A3M-1-3]|uniref:ATP-binding protein n=1 Tax=Streptomyces sp. A3M-1-3 TaxID=2962044 RepID=UPI0020B71FF2|nr:AAA family ATPase [Streptomyces sp. A3M-1-3]MCP3819404.1 AAA family ATPase [Streptomyces sp. A3M-1-3]
MTPALIGRDHPTAVLRAEIGRAAESHGGLVLVTGEAGIGKTTLVTEAADEARRRGALVLGGTCWGSDGAPGYWPWVQVVRGLRRAAGEEEWARAEEAAGGRLAVLLGEASGRGDAGQGQGQEASGAEDMGFPLYDAVTTALVTVSQNRPVMVVLDDLHWADTASLKLLEFAAQHAWFERLLLVGTYRDAEVEAADHPLQPLILPLVAKATTVTLTGLEREEVGALMALTTGQEPADSLVAEVHLRTGGNPFFVEQTARLWRGGSSVTTIAPGVREAVRRRLSLLPEPVGRVLTSASVLGREFHRQVLAATAAAPVPHVDRLLGQAVTARLVVPRQAGRFAFAHDLVRETLYDALDEADLRHRHAAVVRALDRSPALAEKVFPADLARHAYAAGDELDPDHALDLLLAAAKDAGSRLAFEEQITHRRRARERSAGAAPRRRVVIALDLAQDLHHLGEREEAGQIFTETLAAAREAAEPELLGRVALTLYGMFDSGELTALRDEALREAHALLVEGAAPAPPRPVEELAQELSIRIAVLARRHQDDEALGFGLWARHHAIWGPGTAPERVALIDELMALARRRGDIEGEHFAASLRWVALLETGDPRYLDQYRAFVAMAEQHGLPRMGIFAAVDQSIITALMGRFAESESFLAEAFAYSEQHPHEHFSSLLNHHRWTLALLQGRYEELDELHRMLERGHPCPRLLAAISAVERGEPAPAVAYLAELTATGADQAGDRGFLPLRLRCQAQAAAASGDPELCEQARDAIKPFLGQWAVSMYGWDISGPMVLWSAVLDAAQQRWDAAADGFTAAHRSAALLQARPWSVEARFRLAEVLAARGAPGDAAAAEALLTDVEREAAELGMRHIPGRVRRARAAGSDRPAAAPPASHEFRFDGSVWNLTYAGRTAHVPDAKGLRDLRFLLGRPGSDIPAVHLLAPEGGDAVVAARSMGGDAVLDEEAKSRYKRRLELLDREIDRAASLDDTRRAAEYDREREVLLTELRTAAGLGGRSRRLGDEAERARKTVTARIRDTLRKLDSRHPELAAHLRSTVSTGATCTYRPDHAVAWRL